MDPPLIFGIAISIFFAFFFTCIEVAYLMADKSEIEEDAKSGSVNGRIFYFFIRKQDSVWIYIPHDFREELSRQQNQER